MFVVNQENVKQVVEELALKLGKIVEWQENNQDLPDGFFGDEGELAKGVNHEDLLEIGHFLKFVLDLYQDKLWQQPLFKKFFQLNPGKKILLFLSEEAEKRKGPGRRKQVKYFLILSRQGLNFAEQRGKKWHRDFVIQSGNDLHQQLALFYRSDDQFKHIFLRVILEYARLVDIKKLIAEIERQIVPPEMPQDLLVPIYD